MPQGLLGNETMYFKGNLQGIEGVSEADQKAARSLEIVEWLPPESLDAALVGPEGNACWNTGLPSREQDSGSPCSELSQAVHCTAYCSNGQCPH